QHLAEVAHGVSRHRKGQSSLTPGNAAGSCLETHDDERSGIEDQGQRAQPRLAIMLRAPRGQDRKGEMDLEQLCRPDFPLPQVCVAVEWLRPGFLAYQ